MQSNLIVSWIFMLFLYHFFVKWCRVSEHLVPYFVVFHTLYLCAYYIELFFKKKKLSVLEMSVRQFQWQHGLFRWSCDLWVYIFARLLHFITWYLDHPLAESTLHKFSWSPSVMIYTSLMWIFFLSSQGF
ncbi:hypothetical protein PAHAL_7G347500 [Panicum hallii]|jgi:hypothetical protein|uniref:Uncharacterized protein n=1 Tax=Panicum hallii TaxID=206008 RepID=A0A2T8IEG5_9POAL|nr:hypothetical protein PAHAL_7G347500 [Panicum hallii]